MTRIESVFQCYYALTRRRMVELGHVEGDPLNRDQKEILESWDRILNTGYKYQVGDAVEDWGLARIMCVHPEMLDESLAPFTVIAVRGLGRVPMNDPIAMVCFSHTLKEQGVAEDDVYSKMMEGMTWRHRYVMSPFRLVLHNSKKPKPDRIVVCASYVELDVIHSLVNYAKRGEDKTP